MALKVTASGAGGLGRVIEGLDLGAALAPGEIEGLRAQFRASPVLCLRGGPLTAAQFRAVARQLGTPQVQVLRDVRHADFAEISHVSSTRHDTAPDGKRVTFGRHWHTDDSYMRKPCAVTLLYADVVPDRGGDTEFANMHAAYDALPTALRTRVRGLRAVHRYQSRRNLSPVPARSPAEESETPDVSHPLVRTHPQSGRPALYLNPNRIDHVVGLPRPEGDALLDALLAHATRPEHVYRHRWRENDLVIWDNRCIMHRANADYGTAKREMLRILLEGTVPS